MSVWMSGLRGEWDMEVLIGVFPKAGSDGGYCVIFCEEIPVW